MGIKVNLLQAGYGKKVIINNISFEAKPGDFLCILGPNGAGKTTLFKALLGLITPIGGSIELGCENTFKERAKKIAYIPQIHSPVFNYTVADYVLTGRTPHIGRFSTPSKDDERIAYECLERLGLEKFKDRGYATLSGGERQLVQIAKALAQQARIFVMDEPTSALDYGNQFKVMYEVYKLSKEGMSVIMTSHNPNHALHFANKSLLLKDGEILKFGDTEDVVNDKTLKEIYGLNIKIVNYNDGEKTIRTCLATDI